MEDDNVVTIPVAPPPIETLPYWGRGPGEDITRLPQGWDIRVTPEGRVFFIDHSQRKTQWTHPTIKMKYRVAEHLPYGWQLFKDKDGKLVYVDHIEGVKSKVDPRLLNRVAYDFPEQYGIESFNPLYHRIKPYATCEDVLNSKDLTGKVAIVTGANSGLGFETARCLASHGCHVILACRDNAKGVKATNAILEKHPSAKVECRDIDLSSLRSIKLFAELFIACGLPLHILVCNAGVYEPSFVMTEDKLESHFAVNYLGHYYLTMLLTDVLLKSEPSRVVVVTSESHWYPSPKSSDLDLQLLRRPQKETYNPFAAYGSSKLCCLLFTLEYHRRYSGKGVCINAVHPGNLLPTNLMRNANCSYTLAHILARPFTNSVPQAVSSIVFCAGHPIMENISGLYIYRCRTYEPSFEAQSAGTASALWELSNSIVSSRASKWETTIY